MMRAFCFVDLNILKDGSEALSFCSLPLISDDQDRKVEREEGWLLNMYWRSRYAVCRLLATECLLVGLSIKKTGQAIDERREDG
jgi:hypothetical protein